MSNFVNHQPKEDVKYKLGSKVRAINTYKAEHYSVQFVEGIVGLVKNFSLNLMGHKFDYQVIFTINGVQYEGQFSEDELVGVEEETN